MKVTTTKNPLTEIERTRFAELEPVIQMGMANFIVVGKALLEISDSRLYREQFSTFKEYVETKYDISVSRAYQLCEAAEVVKSLPKKVSNLLDTAAKATAILQAPEETRESVLKAAAKEAKTAGEPLTAKRIAAKVQEVAPDPEPEPEPLRNDKKLLAALGGRVPVIPTDDPIKERLRRHEEDTFHAFKVAVGKLIADLPKNVDTFLFSEWLHAQANLLSNRRDQQKNMRAYA